MHLAIEPAEQEALERAAPAAHPAERARFYSAKLMLNNDPVLAVDVYATAASEATTEADHVWRRIHDAAGLPPRATTILGYISPWWKSTSVAAQLAHEALELLHQGRHELSVIRAQTSAELHVRHVMATLLAECWHGVDIDLVLPRRSLVDGRSRLVAKALTGQDPGQLPWWPSYATT